MNAERLLAQYDEIFDAPDAIPRLRRFILDLAVRGKLVDQDADDEPASELLKQITAEKVRLVKRGKIKKPKPLPEIVAQIYDLPPTWNWTRIRQIASDRGQTVPNSSFTYIDVTAITKETGNITNPKILRANEAPSRARKLVRKGDVLYSCVRPYLLNVAVLDTELDPAPIASTAFAILNGHGLVLPRYIWIVLRSSFMIKCVEEHMRGQAYPAINDPDFSLLPFPLSPLAEQHRIIAKVDGLMAICDRLETARTERERTRNRLATATLARLNAPDPDATTFQNHAAFALENLTLLTTRPDQINALRQTILNLAVRGKLVPQNLTDEPASRLLARIVESKRRSRRNVDGISEPYGLPATWTWAVLDKLIETGPQNGVSPKPTTQTDAPKAITLTATTSGTFKPDNFKHVEATISDDSELWLRDGDLLFQRGNTREYVGIAAIYEGPSKTFLFPDLMMRVRVTPLVDLRFVHLAAISPPARTYFSETASGAQETMPKINQTILVSLRIPLPPLAEQHRIVAKVDEMIALCDRLEESLSTRGDIRRRLLDAILHHALEPDTDSKAAA